MFDAYIQVYKKTDRLERSLSSFRKFYPDSSIVLFSDNGDDLSDVALDFSCTYFHSNVNTGISPMGFSKDQAIEWIKRFKRSFDIGKNPYLIYMEDDVLIRNHINVDPEVKIAGTHENPIDHRIIEYFENKYGFKFCTDRYGACGGSIYEKETFLNLFDRFIDIINNDFDTLENDYGYRLGFLDIFMPVFYMANGICYRLNTQMIETHRDANWINTQHPIVHGKSW